MHTSFYPEQGNQKPEDIGLWERKDFIGTQGAIFSTQGMVDTWNEQPEEVIVADTITIF